MVPVIVMIVAYHDSMTSVTIDIVAVLPRSVRELACTSGFRLGRRMREMGGRSCFQLGEPLPGRPDEGVCEPHVSMFMLRVDESEIDSILDRVAICGGALSTFSAYGQTYLPNPVGAPELHYRKSPEWVSAQRVIVSEIEPLRRGRLREIDPTGDRIDELIAKLRVTEPDGSRLHQLLRYGYDEITDERGDRFNPHVTLAWPADGSPVPVDGLVPPSAFDMVVGELAVYGMGPWGTCVEKFGSFALADAAAAGRPSAARP